MLLHFPSCYYLYICSSRAWRPALYSAFSHGFARASDSLTKGDFGSTLTYTLTYRYFLKEKVVETMKYPNDNFTGELASMIFKKGFIYHYAHIQVYLSTSSLSPYPPSLLGRSSHCRCYISVDLFLISQRSSALRFSSTLVHPYSKETSSPPSTDTQIRIGFPWWGRLWG